MAKLFIGKQERELLNTNITYYRNTQATGKPSTETMGGIVTVSFTPRGDEDELLEFMFADRTHNENIEYPYCLYILKEAEIIFYEDSSNDIILFKYKLEDCTLTYYKEIFSNEFGMKTTIGLSAAIQHYKKTETPFLKSWQENWIPPIESQTAIYKDKKEIPEKKSKVLVSFRTGNNYKGEYGFDWIRVGDTGKPGDVWYKNIIGECFYNKDSLGKNIGNEQFRVTYNKYIKLGEKFEMFKHPIKPNDRYVVPVLALMPNEKARLTLKLEIEKADAKKISFKYNTDFFELNKEEISYKNIGKKELAGKDELVVKCINEFDEKQYIEVIADGKLAGKLKFIPNDKSHRYKTKILFVNVTTNLNGRAVNTGKSTRGDKDFKLLLNQALTKATYDTVELNES